jgi:geranylgeranyl pyrophosphate synthase
MRSQAGHEIHPDLRAAFEHLLNAGGKRVRPTVIFLVGNMLDAPHDKLVTLGASVEMLHTATLVHDDLIDGALLRRGMPTLNARWSPAATVLTGDFLFSRAAKLAADADYLPLMKQFAAVLGIIVNGELTQMFTSKGLINRENYYQRIYAKTASLFEMSALSAAMIATEDETIRTAAKIYGYEIGMAFQIVDDVLDFAGEPNSVGKPCPPSTTPRPTLKMKMWPDSKRAVGPTRSAWPAWSSPSATHMPSTAPWTKPVNGWTKP